MFTDRTAAGEELAAELDSRGIDADLVVGVPRGGLPVADPVANRLGVPLDIVVAKKIALPPNQEYAVGAVSADGDAWYDDETIEELNVDEDRLEDEYEKARLRAAEKRDAFRDGRSPPDIEGAHVVIVDDGIATGATMRACIRSLQSAGAARVTVAVPVASPTTVPALELEADEVIALYTPERFRAVGQFYDDFEQVSTTDAVRYLQSTTTAR